MMRVAILHDYLNQFGGAERVLQVILDMFPNADLYTLLYDEKKTFGLFKRNIKKASILNYPFIKKHHRMFIPFMPFAAEWLTSQEKYDLIISSAAGYGKGFGIHAPYHISYCHSPLRYAWEIDYLKNLSFSPHAFSQIVAHPIAKALRAWDKNAAQRVNVFIANSDYIAQKIKNYYGRYAYVVHPPVDTSIFYPDASADSTEDYFLMVGRLLYYKVFDIGIRAFNALRMPLKIVGNGPEIKKLKSIAHPNIEFLSFVPDDELRHLYTNARALIFPQVEDFGLVAAEAHACGLPVIAFNQGGAREIVEHKKTGLLFDEQTPESLARTVKQFEQMRFDRQYIATYAANHFNKKVFQNEFKHILRASGFWV